VVRGVGSGKRCNNTFIRDQVIPLRWDRRLSHRRQVEVTLLRNIVTARLFPKIAK
jgi:hypothetical protein